MIVFYRDDLGIVCVVGVVSVQFLDGFAYFDDGNTDYKIPVSNIVEMATDR
jgi:hypothetical protein